MNDEGATADIEQEHAAENDSPTIDDTIRQTLDAIGKRNPENPENPEKQQNQEHAAKPENPENPENSGRRRAADGKFAPKEAAEDHDAGAAEVEQPADVPVVTPAPNTWRKEVAAKWAELPAEVQSEVLRRESDFHKGIEQYRSKAEFGAAIERAVAPYAATLQSLGIGPDRAVAELMAADHRLRYGSPHDKHTYFAQLAQNYGIDLGQLSEVVSQQPQAIDPNYAALQQELRQVRGMVESRTLAEQRREQEALHSDILRFAADPSHSHFEQVKGHMAALLQAGQAENLADAYEQAVYANPSTRQAMLQQQAEKMRKEAAAKAEAARKAAGVHVRSRPGLPTQAPIGTMDDTIRATLARLTA